MPRAQVAVRIKDLRAKIAELEGQLASKEVDLEKVRTLYKRTCEERDGYEAQARKNLDAAKAEANQKLRLGLELDMALRWAENAEGALQVVLTQLQGVALTAQATMKASGVVPNDALDVFTRRMREYRFDVNRNRAQKTVNDAFAETKKPGPRG